MNVLTPAEWPAWCLEADLADARFEVRRLVILQMMPHWTPAGLLMLAQYEREARAEVRRLQAKIERARQAQPTPPPKPALPAPAQLLLPLSLPLARGPPGRKRARGKPG